MEDLIDSLGLICIPIGEMLIALPPTRWTQFTSSLMETLKAFHADNPDLPGIGMDRLRLQLDPRLAAPAFAAALRGLSRAGEVALDGAGCGCPVIRYNYPKRRILWLQVEPLLAGSAGFHPPRVRDIAEILAKPEAEIRRLLKLAGRMGKVHEVAHDHFFLRAELARMVEIVAGLTATKPGGQFTAAQFRDRVGSGRKVAVHILEFLDLHGVTVRRGDLRRVNSHRLDLFRRAVDTELSTRATSGGALSPGGRPDFKSGSGRPALSCHVPTKPGFLRL